MQLLKPHPPLERLGYSEHILTAEYLYKLGITNVPFRQTCPASIINRPLKLRNIA